MKKNKIEHYSDKEALEFHLNNKSGKIEIISSKPMTTKRDLALAYSPGVAAPVRAISDNPEAAFDYTSKGNLVAVISNGSAILGLGNLGSLASKPVMEGKSVLFKRFADIDSIDIEIDNENSEEIISTIKNIAGTFGGINLEDIAAPDCFIIESKLMNRSYTNPDTNKFVFLRDQPNQHSSSSGVRRYSPLDRLLFSEMYGNYFIKGEVNLTNQGAANLNVVDSAFGSPINASNLVSTRNIEEVMKLGDFKMKVRMMNRMPHLHASYMYSNINGVLIQ